MSLPRYSGRKKCRDSSSKTIFSTYHHRRPPKADKRYENSARQPIDGPLETSLTNSSGYFRRLDLPEKHYLIKLNIPIFLSCF